MQKITSGGVEAAHFALCFCLEAKRFYERKKKPRQTPW